MTLSTNSTQLRETFRRYAEWNHRDGADLFVDQSRKFAVELYTQTAALAPTRAEIAQDVRALGWKIPTRFADGRLGRGTPSQWIGAALQAAQRRVKRRGRKGKKDYLEEDEFKAQRPTLAQMQAFVIAARARARKYLASGWLGAIEALGGSLSGGGAVDSTRGGATITREPGSVSVELWNRTPGIEKMDAQHSIVAKAIAVRSADMWAYIVRKMKESRAQLAQAA